VITTGGSTLKSVEKLKAVGATVLGVIAIAIATRVAITTKADIRLG
jgi:orotate phosphoribosyltransferase